MHGYRRGEGFFLAVGGDDDDDDDGRMFYGCATRVARRRVRLYRRVYFLIVCAVVSDKVDGGEISIRPFE